MTIKNIEELLSFILATIAVCILTCSCTPAPLQEPQKESQASEVPGGDNSDQQSNNDDNKTESMTIKISAGGKTFTARIEDTETGKAFIAKLPLTLDMSELNGNEKYCYGVELPRADKRFDSIAAGDLMLYSGNCVVLFYGGAGGYNYTRIGKLTGTDGLKQALGAGSVRVTFSRSDDSSSSF